MVLSALSNTERKVIEKLNVDEKEIQPLEKYKDDKEIHVGDFIKKY